jgi:FkbM family methyltransferase
MKLLAHLFRLLFRLPPLRKRYYGMYRKVFRPRRLFSGHLFNIRIDRGIRMQVDAGEWIQQHLFFFGEWDPPTSRFLKHHLKEGETFVDAGANIGYFSLLASRLVGSTGQVIAFEPAESLFRKLTANLDLNPGHCVLPVQQALWEAEASLDFHLPDPANAGMGSLFPHKERSGGRQKVRATAFDTQSERLRLQKVHLIKIDVEGAEWQVLMGMRQTLARHLPVLILEDNGKTNGQGGQGMEAIEALLLPLGYEGYYLSAGGWPTSSPEASSCTNRVFMPRSLFPSTV